MSIDEWRSDHAINLFLFFSLGVAFGTRKYEQSSDHLIDNLGMTWKCPHVFFQVRMSLILNLNCLK